MESRVLWTSEIKREMKTIVNNDSAHAAPKFLPSTANSVLLGDPVFLHPSKHDVLQCPASSKLGKCSLRLQRLQLVLSMQANIIRRAVLFFLEQILLCQAKTWEQIQEAFGNSETGN